MHNLSADSFVLFPSDTLEKGQFLRWMNYSKPHQRLDNFSLVYHPSSKSTYISALLIDMTAMAIACSFPSA